MKIQVTNSPTARWVKAPGYNCIFGKKDGLLMRWGDKFEEDPDRAPAPELLDIEIGTACSEGCAHCYKANTGQGKEMSLEMYRQVLGKIPATVHQIAFGIGDIEDYLWPIFAATAQRGIIPNLTVHGKGMTDEIAACFAEHCAGVAVSHYGDGEVCFDAVDKLHKAGVTQLTIHQVLSEDTLNDCYKVLGLHGLDDRIIGLDALTFLALKPKGRGAHLKPMKDAEALSALLSWGLQSSRLTLGFDSCSAHNVADAMEGTSYADEMRESIEPCESGLFSLYIDVEGKAFPCSFTPGTPGWEEGIDVLAADDFIRDVWNHPRLVAWTKRLLANGRRCPLYDLDLEGK